MERLDFFLHSNFSNKDRYYARSPQYFDSLFEAYESSQEPALVLAFAERGVPGMDTSRVFRTVYELNSPDNEPEELGFIIPGQWERFSNMLDENKELEMRIHGCFLGECVSSLIMQIYHHLEIGANVYPYTEIYDEAISEVSKLEKKFEKSNDFKNSNIRLGNVLAKKGLGKIKKPSFFGNVYGNMNYQLSDDKTRIFYI